MHLTAYAAAVAALLASFVGAGWSLFQAARGDKKLSPWIERLNLASVAFLTLACLILLRALVGRDFSFQYVAQYTDRVLPLFYAVTSFWAGQAGSILFWQWMIALIGVFYQLGPGYARLSERAKIYYWLFFLPQSVFFLYVLTGVSNPFLQLSPAPADGQGLNPLLQNPGMIFHPPLLFLGYAGFSVPTALAFAYRMTGEKGSWLGQGRNYCLVSWAFLSAGILLGAWWSYMELGWGGYWAWDPVENASLIPWLSATALLHTALIESRRGSLQKTNIFLVGLTLLLCYFGTYLVRSGIIDSLHAFGEGGVGTSLTMFMLFGLAATLGVAFLKTPGGESFPERPLSSMASRQGLLVLSAWLFLCLGAVVMMGTMWPVVSRLWSNQPVGLDANFYNRVCLPLFALLALLFVFCPWLGWREGVRKKPWFMIVLGALVGSAAILFAVGGIRLPTALVGAASGVTALASIVLLFLAIPEMRRSRLTIGAYAIHAGMALMAIGVAFSGPYQREAEAVLAAGQSVQVGDYSFTYKSHREESGQAMALLEATLEARKGDQFLGTLEPQRRIYRNFPNQQFAEVSTIFSLGDELYATLLGVNEQDAVSVKVSVHPLINWIWIGSVILCLAPFLCLRQPGERREDPAVVGAEDGRSETAAE